MYTRIYIYGPHRNVANSDYKYTIIVTSVLQKEPCKRDDILQEIYHITCIYLIDILQRYRISKYIQVV